MRDEVLRGFTALLLAAREVVEDYGCSCDDPSKEHCSYDDLKEAVQKMGTLLGEIKVELSTKPLSWFKVKDNEWVAEKYVVVEDKDGTYYTFFNNQSLGESNDWKQALSKAEKHRLKT